MKELIVLLAGSCSIAMGAAIEFQEPIRLTADGKAVRVESPGYAAPCWTDIDRDGKEDLLVGQFNRGKIHVFKGMGGLKFQPGEFLKAEGEVAEVPGVW